MDVQVRHVRTALNLLDTPTSLEQQPEVTEDTGDISGDTTWAQPCSLSCYTVHVFAYTVVYSCQTQSNIFRLLCHTESQNHRITEW